MAIHCFKFMVSDKKSIQIKIETEDKISFFSNTKAILCDKDKEVLIMEDYMCEVVEKLYITILKLTNGKLLLNPLLKNMNVGYEYNQWVHSLPDDYTDDEVDLFSEYWLWSSTFDIQTWIYHDESCIFLEVSPSYKWLYREAIETAQDYVSFDEFIKNYSLIDFLCIDDNTLLDWKDQCEYIISLTNSVN